MTTVWVVTRRFHYAGMDNAKNEILGVFSTAEKAGSFAMAHDWTLCCIANDCEIEEVELDNTSFDGELDDTLDISDNTPEEEAVLDEYFPGWRDLPV